MKALDNYKLKLRIFALGSLVWNILIYYSKIVLFLFFLITSILFWAIIGGNLFNSGVNFLDSIQTMLKIVILATGFVIINEIIQAIKGIKKKDEKDM